MSRNTIVKVLFPLSVGFGEQKQMLSQVPRIYLGIVNLGI